MITVIRNGGPPIWVILLFGLIALVDAALIARRADARKLAFLRAMTLALVFCTITGFAGGVAAAIRAYAHLPPDRRAPVLLLYGFSEALADIVVGCALLAMSWFIAAIGIRRRPPDEPAGA
jgi:hypothetical protein